MNFVHLKVKTEFSITEGINKIKNVVKKAKENNMASMAITDNGLFGGIKFYKECLANGVKPIVGVDLVVEQDGGSIYNLTVLAKNQNGYKSIVELISRAQMENKKTDIVAAVKEDWLADLNSVVILSGAKNGLIGKEILSGNVEQAIEIANQMKDFFGSDFYIELQRDGTVTEEKYMDGAVRVCQETGIAPVATHPVMFLNSDDFLAHEARYCAGHKQNLFDMEREKLFNKEMYFKTSEEMVELFSDLPEALENTVEIAKKCNLRLSLDNPKLPNFIIPDGETPDSFFEKNAKEGLEERLAEDFPDEEERASVRAKYDERLGVEIEIIKKMGFPGYFLIVADFINWAKKNDIPIGPGRGSGAGSLVAYAMKITDLDPLPYNLLFERFLNPDRVSMPDFDIDMCQSRRNEVYEYVRDKYGEQAVSQIGTFGTMASKAVIRDVGRTLGYSYDFVDTLAKMVNIPPTAETTLAQFIFGDEAKGIKEDEKLLKRYRDELDVRKLIDIALKLEGITRQLGTHAAGVVISPTKLTDFTPVFVLNSGDSPSTQFDMSDVEKAGLVKFDFLGLRNLTIIKNAVDLINDRKKENGEKLFNLKKIDLQSPEVYKNIFANGNTMGIFQFEGKGMTAVLQKANPEKLEDLIAINALYRPGPKEIIPDWLASKNLKEEDRHYPHPKLRGILKETYGFMIYQEQVMQCAQIIANYSLGGADLLRRAMGKKKPEEMRQQREVFIKGASENGVNSETATQLFDLIEKFSGYGFNKSHAAAYSYIAYQTAYLKNYFPSEFLTANLNSHIISSLDTDKIALLVEDSKKNNIEILPPDINRSGLRFSIESDKEIRYALSAIKGVGEKAATSIEKEREKNGDFLDFYDFLERVGRGNVNKRVIEALVKAGVFDSLYDNRAELFAAIPEGLDYVTKYRKKQMDGISVLGDSLLGGSVPTKSKKKEVDIHRPELPKVDEWDELQILSNEKSVLGFYFTSNPFSTYYAKELGGFKVGTNLCDLNEKYENGDNEAYIAGIIEEVNVWKSKKGAFVKITDGTSTAEFRVFADFLDENRDWFKEDSFVSLRVKMDMDENNENLTLNNLQAFNFDQTKKLLMNKIFVGTTIDKIESFNNICSPFEVSLDQADLAVIVCVEGEDGRRNKKEGQFLIKADLDLVKSLKESFGDEWVVTQYKTEVDNVRFPEIYKKNGKKDYKKKKNSFSV